MITITRALVAAGLALALAAPSLALDKVTLKDGRVLEGEIVQQTENLVQIRIKVGGIETVQTIWMGDVASVVREAATAGSDAGAGSPPKTDASSGGAAGGSDTATAGERASRFDVTGGQRPMLVVLPLTGTVGFTFRPEEIERIGEYADKLRSEENVTPIIVLDIESGGGLMNEMYEIHDAIMKVKKRHRVVAWIREAISAAAATAFHCDEIYFTTNGTLGAMTGFNAGTGQSLQGEALERWLADASRWAEAGGRDGAIARAMIKHDYLLSYDIDPLSGVSWRDDLSGDFDLSDEKTNLVFNSSNAFHSGFADGIADSREQLAELLDLSEWQEDPSEHGRRMAEEWKDTFDTASVEIPRIMGRLRIAQASPAADALEKIGREIALLQELVRWWDKAPNVCEYVQPIPPKEDLLRQIAALRKQAADIRRGRGG
jgi:ClpP class serine protease